MPDRLINVLEEIQNTIPRRTGRTTRLIDEYIQKLYNNQGEWIEIHDHYKFFKKADYILIENIIRRMYNEHPNDKIEIDKLNGKLKLISCSRDLVLKRLNELHEEYNQLKQLNN